MPGSAAIRSEPDFLWMLGSAYFLSRRYAEAERPLSVLFGSGKANSQQRGHAAYALCGVYQKTGNAVEQIRFALWLESQPEGSWSFGSVSLGSSGFDVGLLLDAEAPVEVLRSFIEKYPKAANVRLVKYSLAVRLARENQYDEAAQLYVEANQPIRVARMRQMAELYRASTRSDVSREAALEAKYKLAEYIAANPDRIYFNAGLWSGYQRYALVGKSEGRFTRAERLRQIAAERKLKDDQEELWRAHLILREVVRESSNPELGRKAAKLAIQCVRQISDRFERAKEIRDADIELSKWLRQSAAAVAPKGD